MTSLPSVAGQGSERKEGSTAKIVRGTTKDSDELNQSSKPPPGVGDRDWAFPVALPLRLLPDAEITSERRRTLAHAHHVTNARSDEPSGGRNCVKWHTEPVEENRSGSLDGGERVPYAGQPGKRLSSLQMSWASKLRPSASTCCSAAAGSVTIQVTTAATTSGGAPLEESNPKLPMS
jgi:hypothetical protein